MKFQAAKLYRGKHFAGYGIAVDGELLEGQLSARTESRGGEPPTVTVTFRLTAEHIENQPVIQLNRGEVFMPSRIPRACRKRGCAGTTTDSSGYCDKHRGEGWVQHQRGLSRHQRGYGSKWDAIRARILKRDNHLCQNCLRNGRAVEARTVDHIIPKAHGGTDADSNLQSLCWPCHKAKTARERIN